MILHLIARLPILALNLVSTATRVEVSAILPSATRPALCRRLHTPNPRSTQPSSFPLLGHVLLSLWQLIQLDLLCTPSQTSFKTHRS
jgi:hypothetical protein